MTDDFDAPTGPPSHLPPPPPPAPATTPIPAATAGQPTAAPPAPPATPPPAAPDSAATAPASDIDSLLDQLHEEMHLEQSTDFDPETPLTTPVDASRPERASAVVIESTGGIDFDPEIPSFGARILGLAVDLGVLLLLTGPGLLIAALGGSTVTLIAGLLLGALGFAAATALYTRGVVAGGQSLGNRVAGTHVVDVRNGAPLDSAHAATRYVVRFLVSPVFLFGYLIALGNRQRRTFHDSVAGSVVSRPARQTWSLDDETA